MEPEAESSTIVPSLQPGAETRRLPGLAKILCLDGPECMSDTSFGGLGRARECAATMRTPKRAGYSHRRRPSPTLYSRGLTSLRRSGSRTTIMLTMARMARMGATKASQHAVDWTECSCGVSTPHTSFHMDYVDIRVRRSTRLLLPLRMYACY